MELVKIFALIFCICLLNSFIMWFVVYLVNEWLEKKIRDYVKRLHGD